MDIADAIRRAARKQGITLTELRDRAGLPNGTFYNILAGRPVRILRTLERLKAAGVVLPRNLI